ncbi:MAG TPA: hypothetical protein VHQ46_05840 [Desulfobacteria bacterium]|nr:hypothetical protein [Desulfobacteria bacterium]
MQLNKESVYEVKDGEAIRKAIMEAEVVGRKCQLYASIAQNNETRTLMENTTRDMERAIDKMKKVATRYM